MGFRIANNIIKSIEDKKKSVTDSTVVNNIAQCKIVWYPWLISELDVQNNSTLFQNLEERINDLSASYSFDISNHLVDSVSFSKTMDMPAGSFSFALDNSRDWKNIMKPGQWLVIMMSQDGDLQLPEEESSATNDDLFGLPSGPPSLNDFLLNVRAVCYIDRVAVQTSAEGNGEFNVAYEISGRDFGCVYENTELWFNYFTQEQSMVLTLYQQLKNQVAKDVGELIKLFHDLFLAPDKRITGKLNGDGGITAIPKQWLLPKKLVTDLNMNTGSKPSYFGNIDAVVETFESTPCAIPVQNPLALIEGNLWSKLKETSIQDFHELFTETDETGHPRLFFRPIPWGVDQRGYPTLKQFIPSYKEYAEDKKFKTSAYVSNSVDLSSVEVIATDIGEDNHARYNNYLVQVTSAQNGAFTTVGVLKGNKTPGDREFPFSENASISRHGFKPVHVNMNSLSAALSTVNSQPGASVSANKNGSPSNTLVLEYQEVLRDYWNNGVFFESGTITIMGRKDVKVGKVLSTPDNLAYHQNKYFYIEAYTDDFIITDSGATMWTQKLQVTRGMEIEDLEAVARLRPGDQNSINFGSRTDTNQFKNRGSFTKG